MTEKKVINEFLDQKALAIAGVSRSGKKFGNAIYKEMKKKGYELFIIHPSVDEIDGNKCYKSFKDLPENINSFISVVPPEQTIKLLQDAKENKINKVWLQPGSRSEEAVKYCEENGIEPIQGYCVLMFLEPVGFIHKVHKGFLGLFGKLPK